MLDDLKAHRTATIATSTAEESTVAQDDLRRFLDRLQRDLDAVGSGQLPGLAVVLAEAPLGSPAATLDRVEALLATWMGRGERLHRIDAHAVLVVLPLEAGGSAAEGRRLLEAAGRRCGTALHVGVATAPTDGLTPIRLIARTQQRLTDAIDLDDDPSGS